MHMHTFHSDHKAVLVNDLRILIIKVTVSQAWLYTYTSLHGGRGVGLVIIAPHTCAIGDKVICSVHLSTVYCIIMFFADDLVQTTFQKLFMNKLKDCWSKVKDPCTLAYIPSVVPYYLWVSLNYAHAHIPFRPQS